MKPHRADERPECLAPRPTRARSRLPETGFHGLFEGIAESQILLAGDGSPAVSEIEPPKPFGLGRMDQVEAVTAEPFHQFGCQPFAIRFGAAFARIGETASDVIDDARTRFLELGPGFQELCTGLAGNE